MRIALLLLFAACQDKQPLTNPPDIWSCNLDTDCDTDTTCSCDGCVAHNRSVHAERCPMPCKTNACAGKQAVCVEGRCEIK